MWSTARWFEALSTDKQTLTKENDMKLQFTKALRATLLAGAVLGLGMSQAQAWGHHGGYYHGGYRGGWVAPAFIGGALLGAALAAPAYPAYAYPVVNPAPVYPAVVPAYPAVTPGYAVPAPQPQGYFCPTSRQFYPNVPTCNVPWQLI
jgi:hypothetical protein